VSLIPLLLMVAAIVPSTEYRVPGTGAQYSVLRTRYPVLSHDTHVSHTRLVLEGNTIALRVRLFHDDLTLALRRATGRSDLRITAESRVDSVFGAYFAKQVKLEVDGRPVALRVTASGMEQDAAAQEIVWYVLEGGLERPASRIVVLDGLLFEVFADQQNILQLLRMPEDQRRTLYFTASDPREQRIDF
jgi:hypothetical protein